MAGKGVKVKITVTVGWLVSVATTSFILGVLVTVLIGVAR